VNLDEMLDDVGPRLWISSASSTRNIGQARSIKADQLAPEDKADYTILQTRSP